MNCAIYTILVTELILIRRSNCIRCKRHYQAADKTTGRTRRGEANAESPLGDASIELTGALTLPFTTLEQVDNAEELLIDSSTQKIMV